MANPPSWLFWTLNGPVTLFWLLAYVFAIHRATVDKRSGIPPLVMGANFAWELSLSLVIDQNPLQRPSDFSWWVLDIFILRQTLRYGWKDYPALSRRAFRILLFGVIIWSMLCIIIATYEFNDTVGIYTGVAINIILSLSFIWMLQRRGSSAGQSMYVAICKGLGSFFAGLTVMMMFPGRYLFVFWFPTVWALDTLYSVMLYHKIRSEGASPWALNRPAVVPDSERTASGVAPRVSAPAAGGGG